MLQKELGRYDIKYFKARQLQQDPLENFFGKIRQKGRRNVNPTCTSFAQIYKSCLINILVTKHSMGANCEDDGGHILFTLDHFFNDVSFFN